MSREHPIGEDDLQAWVDDRLRPDRRDTVEAYLAERPEIARRLQAQRRTTEALRARLQFLADEPIPARLRIGNIGRAARDTRHRRTLVVALACIWVALGFVGGWLANDFLGPMVQLGSGGRSAALAREGMEAHRTFVVETVHPVEVRSTDRQHLTQWVAKRLGKPVPIPDLSEAGFTLMGGRVLPAGQHVAAQLMYDDGQGSRLTVYIRTGEQGDRPLAFMPGRDAQAFYWLDDGCGYVVSADIDRRRLRDAAELAYRQFERPPERSG